MRSCLMRCSLLRASAARLLLMCACMLLWGATCVSSTARVPVFVHDAFFAQHTPPTQIHLALVDDTAVATHGALKRVGMTVSWATAARTNSSVVRFSQNPASLSHEAQAETPCEQYDFCDYSSPWFHHVVIDGAQLLAGTTYYYQCGDPLAGWSDVLSFTTALPIGSKAPISFGVIGDLGQTTFSKQTLRHLAQTPSLTAILHAGDLSYADSEQPRWDSWGRLIQPLSARLPWMVAAGNHEQERPCQRHVDPFVAYQVRFRMPFDRHCGLQRRNLYFAFRVGLVHFIHVTPYVAFDATSDQYKWLERELTTRVDRSVTPWVCVLMHGPWYNSNTAHQGAEPHIPMKHAMESLLYAAKVDLVVSGHVHAYERSLPVYNNKVVADGTVYWVVGDAGNREGLAPTYIDPQPVWSAFRQADYGYGLFHIRNSTHAQIEWYEDREVGDAVLRDAAWLTTTRFRAAAANNSDV